MREEAILRKMEEGRTREEAEEEVTDMVFVVDRSIVFLEANKKDGKYTQAFVSEVADLIVSPIPNVLNICGKAHKLIRLNYCMTFFFLRLGSWR